jgi:hypothetical protein
MSDSQFDVLEFIQNNDVQLTVAVVQPDTKQPFNLTGCTVRFTRKPSRFASDTDLLAKSYDGIIEDALGGIAVVNVPSADNAVAGVTWARVDVISGGNKRTAKKWLLKVSAA